MKNKFTIFILYFCLTINLYSDDLFIEAKNITLNKSLNTSIFEKDVSIETVHKKISSQFAKYNKNTQIVILKDNIIAVDKLDNTVKSNYAEYNNIKQLFKTTGKTNLTTSEKYSLDGEDIYFDNKNKIIKSQKSAILKDLSGNKIYFENFEYLINDIEFDSRLSNTHKYLTCDAQTSGGLLIALNETEAKEFMHSYEDSAIIGIIKSKSEKLIKII